MSLEKLLSLVMETVTTAEYCFLNTLDAASRINTRLMQPFAPDAELTIRMGASPASRKVRDVQQHPQVTLAFLDATQIGYVTLSGSATIETGLELRQRYWRDEWQAFFPSGPAGDDYLLITFVPDRIEVISFVRQVTPSPFGLQPAVLVRSGATWVVEVDVDEHDD